MKTAEEFNNEIKAIPDSELCKRAEEIVSKLCSTGGKSFTMAVPPRIDDPDIVLSEVIRRLQTITSLPSPSLPSDEEIESAANRYAESENDCYTNDYNGYKKGATDMRSLCSTRIAEMEREMKAQSSRMMQLENALKDSQILLKNFKSYATDSSAPVYYGGVSLDDALNTNWNLIKSTTTTP